MSQSANVPTPGAPSGETPKRIAVKDGAVITFDVLRWDEGWDFDCPVCVLRPVVRYSPNGQDADQLVEDVCLDASLNGYTESEWMENGLVDRQFPLKSLKRRWSMARSGHDFPVRGYTASRFRARFFPDPDDPQFLAFEVEEVDADE